MRFTTPIVLSALLLAACSAPGFAADAAATDKAPAAKAAAIKSLAIHYADAPATDLKLRTSDDRQQLLATGTQDNGAPVDLTHHVAWTVEPAGVVGVSASGLVIPQKNGSATITAKSADGKSATLSVSVEAFETVTPINFTNHVVPVFTKAGCNAGGCHGKASGQNGFKLSLLGFEPGEDFEHLVNESRGRRLFPAAPDRSLLLLKATGIMPHGGGARLQADTEDYRTIVRWINQGMPFGEASDPRVTSIEVSPKSRVMARGGDQQLIVTAHYSDGTTEDVTRSALYEANVQEIAKVDEGGRVTIAQQPGDVAVMIRYQARVAVFNATVPLGAPVDKLPPARNFIDELVFAKLKDVGMPPSAVSDDATFIRRVTVDIAGRLPTADEAKAFLEDKDPAKRDKLIDRLLASPEYADYFANKWGALLRNKRTRGSDARGTYAFHGWIRDSLLENKPYDQFVREVITASGEIEYNPPVAWYRQVKDPQAQLEDTAQLFLGMRLQCAQCHHHPFEKWSQQDYFSFSAFFSRVGRKNGAIQGEEVIYHKRGSASATNPKTKQQVTPAGLGDQPVATDPNDDPRVLLVDWMTKKDNPFFARSLTNRYWKHFFGRGLVDPEDDMRETNPATNPQLLAALSKHFVDSNFDMKELIRAICRSTTYQLASLPNDHNAIDKQNFSRYYPKRLTAEVLLDAVNVMTGGENKFDNLPAGIRAVQLPDNSFNANSYFLAVFGRPDSASSCECERSGEPSLAQSLHLLNAKDIQDKLTAGSGRAAKLAADTKRSDEEKITELYHLAFSRDPDVSEMSTAKGYVDRLVKKGQEKDPKLKDEKTARTMAYEDIIWALINTKEFAFNH